MIDAPGRTPGTSPPAAAANLSASLAELNKTLLNYAINASSISTDTYNLYKVFDNKTSITRYIAVEALHVNVAGTENASVLLASAATIGNVYVTSLNSRLSDYQIESSRNEALSRAVQNATSQAKAVSPREELSVKNISISSYSIYPYVFGASMSASAPTIYAGTKQVTESITVVFAYR